jgi:hypothetical protein
MFGGGGSTSLGASANNGIGTERSVNRWFCSAWPICPGATS